MGRTRNSRAARGRTRVGGVDLYLSAAGQDIIPWGSWDAVSGWTPVRTLNTSYFFAGYLDQTAADADAGDYIEWLVRLTGGTYTLIGIGQSAPDAGIVTYTLDGVTLGTRDWYSAAPTANGAFAIVGVVIATGIHTLRAAVLSKNASSTDFRMAHDLISFNRTGP